jgi:hypothetical protein
MENNKIQLIGISGVALSGKDSLFISLGKILSNYKIVSTRLSFADPLKAEINEFTKKHYGISAFTKDPKEKEFIRGLMIYHGMAKRAQTNGKYWTSQATNILEENKKDGLLTMVTDVRFATSSEDEVYWLRKNNGILIHIERILSDGRIVQPANKDESENDPKIKSVADYHLKWPTTQDEDIRSDYVKIQLNELIKRIVNERD